MAAATDDSFLPDDTESLFVPLEDLPGGSTVAVPRLDQEGKHGVGHHSQGRILAAEIVDLDERARGCTLNGINDKASGYRTLAAGLLHAYCLLVRPVIDSEGELWKSADSTYALRQVREHLAESVAFWDPIFREEIPALEEYHRLTKIQQARPDATGLVDLRARALAKVHRADGWSYPQLTSETGLSLGQIQRLIERADA